MAPQKTQTKRGVIGLCIAFGAVLCLGFGLFLAPRAKYGMDEEPPRAHVIVTAPDTMQWIPGLFCTCGKNEAVVDAKLLRMNKRTGGFVTLMRFETGVEYPRHYHTNGWHEMTFLSGRGATKEYDWIPGTVVVSPTGVAMGPFVASEEAIVLQVWHGEFNQVSTCAFDRDVIGPNTEDEQIVLLPEEIDARKWKPLTTASGDTVSGIYVKFLYREEGRGATLCLLKISSHPASVRYTTGAACDMVVLRPVGVALRANEPRALSEGTYLHLPGEVPVGPWFAPEGHTGLLYCSFERMPEIRIVRDDIES